KLTGLDGLIIVGARDRPSYLHIHEGIVEIRSSDELWGLDTYQTIEALKSELGKVSVACIGPAGENMVRYACIINDHGR
ncbi:aldehyde ferredoxin oxidoreductase, partial [Candidatus Bathyarchaeota archaeon]|nr:aldehyde ferredoxin oxidoreductase [Candidatus Bathyarchaeota archaeon]